MTDDRYVLLLAEKPEDLLTPVNELIDQGYEPMGGMTMMPIPPTKLSNAPPGAMRPAYGQTMFRRHARVNLRFPDLETKDDKPC